MRLVSLQEGDELALKIIEGMQARLFLRLSVGWRDVKRLMLLIGLEEDFMVRMVQQFVLPSDDICKGLAYIIGLRVHTNFINVSNIN